MGPGSDPATLSLKGQATVREGALAVTAGGQTTSLQQVSATAHLDGSGPAVFHFTGDLKAGNIGLSSLPAPLDLPLDLRYDMTWNNQSRTLAMTRVAGKAAQFDMSGSGRVQVADAGPTTNLSLEAADLDLAALWQTLRPPAAPRAKRGAGGPRRGHCGTDHGPPAVAWMPCVTAARPGWMTSASPAPNWWTSCRSWMPG